MATPALRRFAGLAATLGWAALALQLVLSIQLALGNGRPLWWGVFMYLGFFTILTNLLVALVLSASAHRAPGRLWDFLRAPGTASAAAASIAIVGLVYLLVLSGLWQPQGLVWLADVLLHYAMPLLFLAYWWLAVPAGGLSWRRLPRWWLYPLGYLAYALVRGAISGVYPYPFIDVGAIGWARTAINAVGVWLCYSVVALLIVGIGRRKPLPRHR